MNVKSSKSLGKEILPVPVVLFSHVIRYTSQ